MFPFPTPHNFGVTRDLGGNTWGVITVISQLGQYYRADVTARGGKGSAMQNLSKT